MAAVFLNVSFTYNDKCGCRNEKLFIKYVTEGPSVLFMRGGTLIVNIFIAPNRQRVVQQSRFCDARTQLLSGAGSHYTDCDGCANKLVLSYGEKGADLCSAPYHKLLSDTCNQPAMKRGEDKC